MNNQDNIQQEYIEWEDHFQTQKKKYISHTMN